VTPPVSVSPAELSRVLTFLPRTRFVYLLRRTVTPADEADPPGLKPKTVLVMGLYDWFAHLNGYITDDQQQRLVAKFDDVLGALADASWRILERLPAVLTLSDGRYAAIHTRPAWYDYELDEELETLPGACVTHVACDLTALLMRLGKRIADLRGGTDAGHTDPGRAADGPR